MIALLRRLVLLILIFVFVFVFVIQAQSKKYERNTAGQLATQTWSRLATTISGEELPALGQSIVNFFLQNSTFEKNEKWNPRNPNCKITFDILKKYCMTNSSKN